MGRLSHADLNRALELSVELGDVCPPLTKENYSTILKAFVMCFGGMAANFHTEVEVTMQMMEIEGMLREEFAAVVAFNRNHRQGLSVH